MRAALTKLDDITIAKIQASGKSVYEFLREAVELKLENDRAIDLHDSLEARIKEHEKRLDQKLEAHLMSIEERVVKGVEVFRKIYEQSVSDDEQFKEKLTENFRKLSSAIKG